MTADGGDREVPNSNKYHRLYQRQGGKMGCRARLYPYLPLLGHPARVKIKASNLDFAAMFNLLSIPLVSLKFAGVVQTHLLQCQTCFMSFSCIHQYIFSLRLFNFMNS